MQTEEKGEGRGREKKKHRFVVPHIYVFLSWFLYVPSPGIEPATLAYRDDWAKLPWPKEPTFCFDIQTTKGYTMKRRAASQQNSDLFSRGNDYFFYNLSKTFLFLHNPFIFTRTEWTIWDIVISILLFFFFLH